MAETDRPEVKEYVVMLRACSTPLTAIDMMYEAADLLGRSATVNRTVCAMVARLLDLPDTHPEVIERVLRDLPTR